MLETDCKGCFSHKVQLSLQRFLAVTTLFILRCDKYVLAVTK